MQTNQELRQQLLEMVSEYAQNEFGAKLSFIPGVTPVPCSGKLIGAQDIQYTVEACLDGWFTTGRFAAQFENDFATYMGQAYCSLTNSGSSANLLAMTALTSPKLGEKKLQPGDEVITVAAGFPTTVNPIIQNGLIPVFVDVNLSDYGIDVDLLERAMSPKVKAVILAHTLGNPFNLDRLCAFAKKYKLWVIEDCCDAVGSTYGNRMVGTFGDLATVSFYPAHHITMGEGGAVLTQSSTLKKIVESFRDWGRDCWCETGCDNTCGKRFDWQLGGLPRGYDHKFTYSHVGYNLKVTDMQAALGLSQLSKIESFNRRRKDNYHYLYNKLQPLKQFLFLPAPAKNTDPAWFGFPMRVTPKSPLPRHSIIRELDKRKIGTRFLFGGNLTQQPYLKGVKYRICETLTNTNKIMENVFWVGLQPNLQQEMLEYTVSSLLEIFNQ